MTRSTVDSGRRRLVKSAALIGVGTLGGWGTAWVARADARVIDIVAKKFEYVPGEIALKRGEPVTLRLTAPEVTMGFNLADFGARTDIVPGQVAVVRFTPDKTGTFTFVCDVFCGSGHEDMSGTIVVS